MTAIKVVAVGAGGSGGRSTPTCYYQFLSGGGGAGVTAMVTVTPGQSLQYCVGAGGRQPTGGGYSSGNCGDTGGFPGGDTYLGPAANPFVRAGGGAGGIGWHYSNGDGRGRPPTRGGTYTLGTGVTLLVGKDGGTVTTRGACGGDSGLAVDGANSGKGACDANSPGVTYGGGGFGSGSELSSGNASAGANGFLEITPQ